MKRKDENYWKLKRKKNYPSFTFYDDMILSEKEKYKRLHNTGIVYIFGKKLEIFIDVAETWDPTPILIDGKPLIAMKILIDKCDEYYTMYILTYYGDLYIIGYNRFTKKLQKNIDLLLGDVYDFYLHNHKLYLTTNEGNVIYYNSKKFKTIWGNKNALKIAKDQHYFILTNRHELFIRKNSIWHKYLDNVKDFCLNENYLTYLNTNKMLWQIEYNRNAIGLMILYSTKKYYFTNPINSKFIAKNIIKFSNFHYVDKNGNLHYDDKILDTNVSNICYRDDKLLYVKKKSNLHTPAYFYSFDDFNKINHLENIDDIYLVIARK